MKKVRYIESPCGRMGIIASDVAVTSIFFCEETHEGALKPACNSIEGDNPLLSQAADELTEYFAGTRHAFSFVTAAEGTPFQRAVWQALCTIPYGETRTYAQIAAQIGNPKACRAVGMANHCNPLPIVVPCHRVIGADGQLTGYAGGVAIKQFLLSLEQK